MLIKHLKKYKGVAVIEEKRKFSYSDLNSQIYLYSEDLSKYIKSGDVIVLKSDYSFYAISLLIAVSRFPCIIIPIVDSSIEEIEKKYIASSPNKIIEISNVGKLIIVDYPLNTHIFDNYTKITRNNECGIVLFSSGSTGLPKIMVQNLNRIIDLLPSPKKQKKLNFLLFLLFDHIGGLNTLLNCLNVGSTVTIPINRKPETIIKVISLENVNVLPTSPTFLNLMMIESSFDVANLSSLKLITYGTERMPEGLLKKIKNKIPHVRLLQTFGTSETGILKTLSKSSDSTYFKISDPNQEYKIIDNELYIKSKTKVEGYINSSNKNFKKNGWFATGDLVDVDNDGYIKIVGRKDNVINVGGLKVLPIEVEDIINRLDEVVDCTVYGLQNSITGHIVCVRVVKNKETEEIELKKKIKNYCKENLDKYKVPAKIIFEKNITFNKRYKKKLNK
tara:strand:- start:17213 stop:18553 length:1341 start_codon:yes stop_codon:yes gene_type:complete